jgi:hypothetical protein
LGFDGHFAEGQAEAGSAGYAGAAAFDLGEFVEDALVPLLGDAWPFVL